MTPEFVVDTTWHRPSNRCIVVAGSPLRMFRLSKSGAAIADALETGTTLPTGHEPLTMRLRSAGAIHPVPRTHVDPSEVTVVIPTCATTLAHAERVRTLATSLPAHSVIVVDDASPHPPVVPPEITGVHIVRCARNSGPGVTRNTGAQSVTTPYVAFVDDDVTVSSDTICSVAAHCAEGAALAAPRVRDAGIVLSDPNWISRYEIGRSPLDLGVEPARVAPLTRVSYVPAAVLVMRTDVFRECSGFDATLRTGEDVDLVWRIAKAHECRYDPSATAYHLSRTSVRAFMRQRVGYGASAAALAERHGRAVAPFASNVVLLAMGVALVFGVYTVAGVLALLHVLFVAIRLTRRGDDIRHACRVAFVSLLHTLRLFADALTRVWMFPCLVLALFIPGSRPVLAAAYVVPAIIEWARTRKLNPLGYFLLRSIDNTAYLLGVWKGILTLRSARCLVPLVSPMRASTTSTTQQRAD